MNKKEAEIREENGNLLPDVIVPEEKSVQAAPKGGIIKSVGNFFGSAFGGKSQDINALIEEFTSEMTLVAEGLSQDQERLEERCDRMEAGLSESEERLFLRMDQVLAKEEENREAMKDMERRLKKTEDRLAKAEERLEKALKTESEKKTHASERWSALLRQATWLVGIACSAWIVITLINKLLP